MFEKATRGHYRFASPQGALTVEDLWDLPLVSKNPARASLDGIAKTLYKQLKETTEIESFVSEHPRADADLQAQFDLVKHIIKVRLAENEAETQKAKRAAEKQKILEIISRKQDAQLEAAPIEDLIARVNEL